VSHWHFFTDNSIHSGEKGSILNIAVDMEMEVEVKLYIVLERHYGSKKEQTSETGIPNVDCTVHPISYIVTLCAVFQVSMGTWFSDRSLVQSAEPTHNFTYPVMPPI
jgi:hypothetical protein